MYLTYGYELRENDDIVVPARRTLEIMSQFTLPGAAPVNHLPFRTVSVISYCPQSHSYIQSRTSLRGFLCSNMSLWQVNAESWAGG